MLVLYVSKFPNEVKTGSSFISPTIVAKIVVLICCIISLKAPTMLTLSCIHALAAEVKQLITARAFSICCIKSLHLRLFLFCSL